MAIAIISTGMYAPPRRISNDDLATMFDTSDEWIRSHTGIGFRHFADPDVATSDLAVEAARNALAMAAAEIGGTAEEIAASLDAIVLANSSPDYVGTPATACIVQHKIGAVKAFAMDVSAGCSGFIYAMETAAGLLLAAENRRRVLVIGAETLSRIIDHTDRGSFVLFGDGAGAVLLEKTNDPPRGEGRRGLQRSFLGSDGSGVEYLLLRRGGSRNPWKPGETVELPPHIEMNGRAVYNFAVKAMTNVIEGLMAEEGITLEDLAWIVPHQANARIVQSAAKRLGAPIEKFYLNIEEYANTSAASIPIALDEMNRKGCLKRGDMILTVGFGAGLTYGGNLIVW